VLRTLRTPFRAFSSLCAIKIAPQSRRKPSRTRYRSDSARVTSQLFRNSSRARSRPIPFRPGNRSNCLRNVAWFHCRCLHPSAMHNISRTINCLIQPLLLASNPTPLLIHRQHTIPSRLPLPTHLPRTLTPFSNSLNNPLQGTGRQLPLFVDPLSDHPITLSTLNVASNNFQLKRCTVLTSWMLPKYETPCTQTAVIPLNPNPDLATHTQFSNPTTPILFGPSAATPGTATLLFFISTPVFRLINLEKSSNSFLQYYPKNSNRLMTRLFNG